MGSFDQLFVNGNILSLQNRRRAREVAVAAG